MKTRAKKARKNTGNKVVLKTLKVTPATLLDVKNIINEELNRTGDEPSAEETIKILIRAYRERALYTPLTDEREILARKLLDLVENPKGAAHQMLAQVFLGMAREEG